jgi:hypothetical protein
MSQKYFLKIKKREKGSLLGAGIKYLFWRLKLEEFLAIYDLL